jgi:hypothetical protein
MELLRQQLPYEDLVGCMDKLVRDGDPKATMYMLDRHLGRPAQSITVSGDPERPLHALIGVATRDLSPPDAPLLSSGEPGGLAAEAHCLDDLEE